MTSLKSYAEQPVTKVLYIFKFSRCTEEKWVRRECVHFILAMGIFLVFVFFKLVSSTSVLDKPSYCASEGHIFPMFYNFIRTCVAKGDHR